MALPLLKNLFPVKKKSNNNKPMNKSSVLPFTRVNDVILGKDGYVKMVCQVSPVNAEGMQEEDIESIVDAIRVSLISWRGRIQILVNSERVRVEKNIRWLEQKQHNQDYDLYIDMIEEQKKSLHDLSHKIRTNNRFYVIIEGKGKGVEIDLRDAVKAMSVAMVEQGMDVTILEREQIMRLLYERLNPNTSLNQPYYEGMPEHLLMPSSMSADIRGVMQIDGRYFQHIAVIHYPVRPNKKYRWLSPVFQVNGNKTISFILNPRPKGKELSDAIGKMVDRLNREKREVHTESERVRKDTEYKLAMKMLESVSNDNETVYDMTLLIEASGDTEEELKNTLNNIHIGLSSPRCMARNILLPGKDRFEAFWGCLPTLYRSDVTDKYYTWNMPSKTVASILPFDSGEFQEESGIFFAENPYNKSPYIFDRYNKVLHDNPHGFTLGLPGSGKTFDEENEIMRLAPLVDHVIVFDPEREYHFSFGKRFNMAKLCTNPFHVRSPIVDSDNDSVDGKQHFWEATLLHIQNMLPIFKYWMPEMTSTEYAMIEEDVRQLYIEANFHENMTSFPSEFPTLSDYKKVAESKIKAEDSENVPGRKRILATINSWIEGVYSHLVNGQTNWDFSETKDNLIVFDIHDLSRSAKNPVYFLLLLHNWQFIKECRQLGQTTFMVVDECHVLMDPKNVEAAEFLFNVNKRGRKYFVALQLITQNLLDFLGVSMSGGERRESDITKYGTAIINNSRFKKIFRIGKLDLQELNQHYSFSKRERKLLNATRGRGKGIMIIGDTQRIEFQTRRLPHEDKYFQDGLYTA